MEKIQIYISIIAQFEYNYNKGPNKILRKCTNARAWVFCRTYSLRL